MTAETPTSVRELNTRVSDQIKVRLLWCEDDGRLWVSVADTHSAHSFCLEVGEDESPVDVFHHPFAYAAHHGVPTDAVGNEALVTPAA